MKVVDLSESDKYCGLVLDFLQDIFAKSGDFDLTASMIEEILGLSLRFFILFSLKFGDLEMDLVSLSMLFFCWSTFGLREKKKEDSSCVLSLESWMI